jgi:hypothetical protein
MKVILHRIHRDPAADLGQTDLVECRVDLEVDGQPRAFTVFVRPNVLPEFDASVVYGDPLLEELLRFEPNALNTLYATVGKHRRGATVALPLVLVDTVDLNDAQLGAERA